MAETPIPARTLHKGQQTRATILDAALTLAAHMGLEGLSIGALAEVTGMSKSGVFAHFGSRTDLQIAVLDEAARRFTEAVFLPAFKAPRGLKRLRALFENWITWPEHAHLRGGCPMHAASAEYDDQPGPMRDAVVEPAHGLIRYRGRRTVVRPFPISIDVEAFRARATLPATEAAARELRRRALPEGGQLLLGVDRVDYTKGIPRRFAAFARLLAEHPELHGRVTLLQVGVPTRTDVPEYSAFEQEVADIAAEVNARFGRDGWLPVELVRESLDQATLTAYYRAADVCIVSPLQDGMNLVAKEYVACQQGRMGILVLSRFAGAARQLKEALLINPYDVGATAEALYRALTLPAEERERRSMALHHRVERHTIHDWMGDIFAEVDRLRPRT